MSKVTQQDKVGSQLLTQALQTGPVETGAQMRAVRFLERALQAAGYDTGKKDTRFTAQTAAALRQFQAAWGLPVTGKLDLKTLAKLDHTLARARKRGSAAPNANRKGFQGTVGRGQSNKDVLAAEKRLRRLGYRVGKADGVFDGQTADAVKAFKQDHDGLKSKSGLLGENAFKALGKAVRGLEHAPYRKRITKNLKAAKRLDDATARAAKKGIGPDSAKKWVKNVQGHLKAAGYNPARTDGVWDERTANALEVFQKKTGLKQTGEVNARTWKALRRSYLLAKDGTSPAQALHERSGAVRRSEKILKKLGYRKVKVDGIFDRATQRASRAFERRYDGLGDNGKIGANQLRRMRQVLHFKQDPGSGPLLKKGYRGKPVRRLQARLKKMGFNPGGVDGDFGPATKAAVKRFQRAFNLKADGVVGKNTWRKLGIDVRGRVRKPGGGGGVSAGGGWGGSAGVANTARRIAARMGIPVTSTKRDLADTIRVGSSTSSDHYTGNTTAYAVDFGVSGSRGTELARALCRAYGISTSTLGTYNNNYIKVGGQTYRVQILWQVSGHYDHVHVGIRRA